MNIIKTSIFLLVLLLNVNIAESAQDQMQQAILLYQSGEISDAIKKIDLLINKNPNDSGAYLNKGIMIRGMGVKSNNSKYYLEAVNLFKKADSLTKDKNEKIIIKGNIGTTYLEMKKYDEAKKYYDEAFKLSNRFFYKSRIAYCLAKEGRLKEAYSIIESISKDQLSDADSRGNEGLTLFNFGIVYSIGRQPKKATKWLESALKLNKKRFSYGIRQDTDLDNIKYSAEFQNLLQKYPL
ncbi:MAG: tetratricopeptide repeat protein [Thermodesulfobacteriota bacterium]